MAKRYHSGGAKMHYSKHEMESNNEMAKRSGHMIYEDHSAPCMLPRAVKDEMWPGNEAYALNQKHPDLFIAVEEQMNENARDARAIYKPNHT